jgi:hypothetical protein
VADNLHVKEVWVGDGERRKRYVLCLNPQEAERERARRQQLLIELDAELALLEQREDDHPKAACALMASRRYARYLSADWRGRPRLDAAKVRAAEKFDGKFVVISNDDAVGRGHRPWLQRRLDHRILLPSHEADGSRRAADVPLEWRAGSRPMSNFACSRRPEGGALLLRGPGCCSADKNRRGAG